MFALAGTVATAPPQCYAADVTSFDPKPVLSAVDGTSTYAQIFNPSWIVGSVHPLPSPHAPPRPTAGSRGRRADRGCCYGRRTAARRWGASAWAVRAPGRRPPSSPSPSSGATTTARRRPPLRRSTAAAWCSARTIRRTCGGPRTRAWRTTPPLSLLYVLPRQPLGLAVPGHRHRPHPGAAGAGGGGRGGRGADAAPAGRWRLGAARGRLPGEPQVWGAAGAPRAAALPDQRRRGDPHGRERRPAQVDAGPDIHQQHAVGQPPCRGRASSHAAGRRQLRLLPQLLGGQGGAAARLPARVRAPRPAARPRPRPPPSLPQLGGARRQRPHQNPGPGAQAAVEPHRPALDGRQRALHLQRAAGGASGARAPRAPVASTPPFPHRSPSSKRRTPPAATRTASTLAAPMPWWAPPRSSLGACGVCAVGKNPDWQMPPPFARPPRPVPPAGNRAWPRCKRGDPPHPSRHRPPAQAGRNSPNSWATCASPHTLNPSTTPWTATGAPPPLPMHRIRPLTPSRPAALCTWSFRLARASRWGFRGMHRRLARARGGWGSAGRRHALLNEVGSLWITLPTITATTGIHKTLAKLVGQRVGGGAGGHGGRRG